MCHAFRMQDRRGDCPSWHLEPSARASSDRAFVRSKTSLQEETTWIEKQIDRYQVYNQEKQADRRQDHI